MKSSYVESDAAGEYAYAITPFFPFFLSSRTTKYILGPPKCRFPKRGGGEGSFEVSK